MFMYINLMLILMLIFPVFFKYKIEFSFKDVSMETGIICNIYGISGLDLAEMSHFVWASVTKCHTLGSLYRAEIYFPQFCRVKIQDQGANMLRL